MIDLLKEFADLLRERLQRKVYTTEDSVRYTFFISILRKTNISHYDIILEFPHPKIPGAKIDTYIPFKFEGKSLVIEFKYDRSIPSGKNLPRPQNVGEVFNDFYRLAKFYESDPNSILWCVYLINNEMVKYFKNEDNNFIDFFELPVGNMIKIDQKYISSKSKTFQSAIEGSLCVNIKCIFKENLPEGHELLVHEVLP